MALFRFLLGVLPWWLRLLVVMGLIYAAGVLLASAFWLIIMLAVMFWVIVILAVPVRTGRLRLPGFLEPLFDRVTNLSGPAGVIPAFGHQAVGPAMMARMPKVTAAMRRATGEKAAGMVERLHGNTPAKLKLESLISSAITAAARGERGLGMQAPATLVLFHGPSGTGRTTLAQAFLGLLYAKEVLPSPAIVSIVSRDIIDTGAGGAGQAAEKLANTALDGGLLIDNGEWLPRRGGDFAAEIGRAFVHVAETNPGRLLVVMTGGRSLKRALLENEDLQSAWLGKWTVHEVALDDLGPEDLLQALAEMSQSANAIVSADARNWVARQLEQERRTMGDRFDNVHAVRRRFSFAQSQAMSRGVTKGALTLTRDDFAAAVS